MRWEANKITNLFKARQNFKGEILLNCIMYISAVDMSDTNNIRQRYLEDRVRASVVMATSLDKATLTTGSKLCQKTERLDIICFSVPEKSIQVCSIFFPSLLSRALRPKSSICSCWELTCFSKVNVLGINENSLYNRWDSLGIRCDINVYKLFAILDCHGNEYLIITRCTLFNRVKGWAASFRRLKQLFFTTTVLKA